MGRGPLNPSDAAILAEIEIDALGAMAARSNASYAEAVRRSVDSVAGTLRRLKERGLIAVETNEHRRRRIYHRAADAWTGWSISPAAAGANKRGAGKRPCICCGEDFPSEHKFHRICNGCKDRGGPPSDVPLTSEYKRAYDRRHHQKKRAQQRAAEASL